MNEFGLLTLALHISNSVITQLAWLFPHYHTSLHIGDCGTENSFASESPYVAVGHEPGGASLERQRKFAPLLTCVEAEPIHRADPRTPARERDPALWENSRPGSDPVSPTPQAAPRGRSLPVWAVTSGVCPSRRDAAAKAHFLRGVLL